MSPHWSSLWLLVPSALLAVLALARLARLRPALRPLVFPVALTAAGMIAIGVFGDMGSLSLLILIPVLILCVRGSVLIFQALFQRSQGQAPPHLLESVISVLFYGLGAAAIVHYVFGRDVTPLLATSAVVGAVVGLALQDTLGNLFAGIALHTEAPFRVGDWIRIGEHEGRVEQVSWRAMRLRTWSGDTLTIPNNEASRGPILNYSLPATPHSRTLGIGVNYGTPPNKVLSVLAGIVSQVPGLPASPPPNLRIVGYNDFSIQYEIRYYVTGYEEYRRAESEILRLIWYHFRRHGIEIPFPIRNVYLHQAPTGADEARANRLERALRDIDLFRPLSDEELRTAASRFRHVHYAAAERIIEEGAPGDSFFVVDCGEVEVSKTMAGTKHSLARLMEGQFFGEMALLTGAPRAATVLAATDVDLFTIDKAGFQDIIVANPAIAVDISTILAERREALTRAEQDLTARFEPAESEVDLRQRILARIRDYFGI